MLLVVIFKLVVSFSVCILSTPLKNFTYNLVGLGLNIMYSPAVMNCLQLDFDSSKTLEHKLTEILLKEQWNTRSFTLFHKKLPFSSLYSFIYSWTCQ